MCLGSARETCDDALPEPGRKLRFLKRAGGNHFHRLHRVGSIEPQLIPVVGEEKTCNHPGGSFVAIREAMITRQAVGIRRRESRRICVGVYVQVLRPRQRGFHSALVSHPVKTAMLGKLAIMDGIGQVGAYPSPCSHLASARKISRSPCMISSASFIWRSKSGLYGVIR